MMTHETIRAARDQLDKSQAEMAALFRVDLTTWKRWERDPSMSTSREAPPPVLAALEWLTEQGFVPNEWKSSEVVDQ